jgi:hypothetical protein
VSGTVTLGGDPLRHARVVFIPDPARGGSGPRGTADTDHLGRYHIRTDDEEDSIRPGPYVVLVIDQAAARRPGGPRGPKQYADLAATPLRPLITTGPNVLDISLTPEFDEPMSAPRFHQSPVLPIPGSGRRKSALPVAVGLVLACLTAGCSREPERGPVSGTVTLDGKPLPKIMVAFLPDPAHGTPGQRSVALTDQNGRYVVYSDKNQDGAVVGKHRVCLYDALAVPRAISAPAVPGLPGKAKEPAPKNPSKVPQDPSRVPPSRVPAAYSDMTRTPLQPVEVGRAAQTYDIALKSH